MYCSHFGLHRPPFNNTPDPTFYFSTPEHDEALATLHYATVERKGFVLVTGEVGAGKTLIARLFLRQIEQEAETAVITNTHLSGRQLLAAVCSEFDLNPPSDASNLELSQLLQEFLLEQFARDRYVVVVIDEAQNLSDEAFEELRMLGNLEADDAKLLQVCILGQPELRSRFSRPNMRQLEQRLFRRFHLTALSAQQTRQYVLHRLRVAGCEQESLFAPEALDAVYLASKGIPRLINQVCDSALLAAYSEGREIVTLDIVDEVSGREEPLAPTPVEAATGRTVAESADAPPAGSPDAMPPAPPAVTPSMTVAALGALAGSIEECVEALADADQRQPEEPTAPNFSSGRAGESAGRTDQPGEPVWDIAEMAKRCQRAREELERLARIDWSTEQPSDRARPTGRSRRPAGQAEDDESGTLGAGSCTPRSRIAGFVDAVRQKCSRTPARKKTPQASRRPGQQNVRPAVGQQHGATADLGKQLDDREQLIAQLKDDVVSRFNATAETLQQLEKRTATAEELDRLRSAHEAALSEMEQRVAENTAALKQLSDSIEERVKATSADVLPEFQALSKRVIEQAQQLQELRKRVLEQHALVTQSLSDIRVQAASRAELERLRAEQAGSSLEILKRIEQNRDDAQMILDDLEDRYIGLRDRIEAVVAAKADAADLAGVRERQEQEFGRLLGALNQQRQELEQKLEQTVAEWKRTQQSLDELASKAADAKELDDIRRRQSRDADRILQMLSAHRGKIEGLARDLDRRAGELLQRLNALPQGIATTEQLAAIRAAYAEQITDLTARLAACEAGFEKARERHDRGLRAVAGKALETARRVSILEEQGRPRRIRLELTPQVGIELGEIVATAQEQQASLNEGIKQAGQTVADLRQATAAVQEAIQKWREEMEANWDKAQALFQNWQREAEQARVGAGQMLQSWRAGADEVRCEADRLRASAKMAADILQKMRQCHGVIEARLNSNEWHAEIARAESLAERLERAVSAGQTVCQQIAGRTEQALAAGRTVAQQIAGRTDQAKQELAAYLADCRKQLAERLAQFAIEQKQMDQIIEHRRQTLANIARSAGSLAEVIEAGRRFDVDREPSLPAGGPPPIESREPSLDTVEQIQWPRFRTHQAQAV